LDSYDYYSLKNKGINLFNRGLYKESIKWFDRALKIKSDGYDSLREKGRALFWLEQCEEAIECYDKALKIKPDDYDSLRNKGIALFWLEKYEESIKYYDKALNIKPDDYDSLRNKGGSLFKLKQYEEAVECYDEAVKFKSNDYDSLREKGIVLFQLGKYKEAIKCFDKALKIKPDDYNSLKNKGNSLFCLNQYEGAIECYDRVLEIKPDDNISLKNKALILEKIGTDRDRKIKSEYMKKLQEANFEYDIALSYAGENREIVEEIAKRLNENNIKVFYDMFEKTKLWGKRLSTHLQKTYGENSCFVLVFVSKEYSLKDWTNFEFTIARGEAKNRKTEFILPIRLDNTILFGLPDDMGYLDFNLEGVEGIVNAIIDKLNNATL